MFRFIYLLAFVLVYSLPVISNEVSDHIENANLMAREGRYSTAMNEINRAIAIDPQSARAYKFRANLHFVDGNYGQAIQDMNHVVDLEPNQALSYIDRAVIHQAMNNTTAARADIAKALQLKPDSEFAQKVKAIVDPVKDQAKKKKKK